MELDQLIGKGGYASTAMVSKEVVWEHKDKHGKTVTDKFDVFVLKELSFAASERIHSAKPGEQASRIITEYVRLGDDGSQQFKFEDACKLAPSLGVALVDVVTEVISEGSKEGDEGN